MDLVDVIEDTGTEMRLPGLSGWTRSNHMNS